MFSLKLVKTSSFGELDGSEITLSTPEMPYGIQEIDCTFR